MNSRLELGEDLHAAGLDADLLLSFAQRGRDVIGVLGIDGTTGKRDLTGMCAHVGRALDPQHCELAVLGGREDDEDGRGTSFTVGWDRIAREEFVDRSRAEALNQQAQLFGEIHERI